MNFIDTHRQALANDHYIRSSQLDNAWVYFSRRKLLNYEQKTGGEFCLVVSGSHGVAGDFHAIPFGYVRDMFTQQTLCDAKDGYERWNCWVEGHTLKTRSMARDVRRFYGNTEVLGYPSFAPPPNDGFPGGEESSEEGVKRFRLHIFRERSQSLVLKKKQKAQKDSGQLECEVCSLVFAEVYGKKFGDGFIECHHRRPLSELDKPARTTLDDLALVCSNCHSMLHRSGCSMTVEQLADVVAQNKAFLSASAV